MEPCYNPNNWTNSDDYSLTREIEDMAHELHYRVSSFTPSDFKVGQTRLFQLLSRYRKGDPDPVTIDKMCREQWKLRFPNDVLYIITKSVIMITSSDRAEPKSPFLQGPPNVAVEKWRFAYKEAELMGTHHDSDNKWDVALHFSFTKEP